MDSINTLYKTLYKNYKDIIPYAVFGVLTTLVNIISYWICAHPLGMPVIDYSGAARPPVRLPGNQ